MSDKPEKKVTRRDFLKGTGAVAIGSAVAATMGKGRAEAAGLTDLAVRRTDKPYEVDDSKLGRFHEMNTCFNRLYGGDPVFAGYGEKWNVTNPLQHMQNNDEGYSLVDYALGHAAESVGNKLSFAGITYNYRAESKGYSFEDIYPETPLGVPRFEGTPEEAAQLVKRAAKMFGASLVGVAKFDRKWLYSGTIYADTYENKPIELPNEMQWQISMAVEMEYEAIKTSPTKTCSANVAWAYSLQNSLAVYVAEFIKGLGYKAAACGNDTALSVPMAIDAGLGEFSRMGMLVTPEYGPRVRLCKVITDLPLAPDKPISFGVREFCKVCKKCATACPSGAITDADEMTWEGPSQSNNPGVKKWYVDVDKCLQFWGDNGSDCTNCIASCPYNKLYDHWHHKAAIPLAPVLGRAFVELDDAFGYGEQASSHEWWQQKKK